VDDKSLVVCGVCQTSFFFAYDENKLAQRETIYRELAEAARKLITHQRTHHAVTQAASMTNMAFPMTIMASSSDSKHLAADSSANGESPCTWKYGSGVASPESVSDVCFGAVLPTMDKFTVLEDMADCIVDKDSVRHLYRRYDAKTNMLVECRRSDRMIDESMNRMDFDATPVLLHCGHTVCRGCAYKCVRAHKNAKYDTMFAMVDCPTRCNRETAFVCDLGVEWLPVDIRRIRLLQEQHKPSGKPMCSAHEDREATVRCTHENCAQFALMCKECDEAEHSSRNSRVHVRVLPSQDATSVAPSTDSVCSKHHQPLTGVCVTDGELVCGQCLFDHSGHEFKRLHEVCSDWSTQLENIQREILVKAHILSDRATSVQRRFDELVSSITTHFGSISRNAINRQNELLFEARRWRKMQLEDAKILAADASQLSATAMYERMLLQRILNPDPDSKATSSSTSAAAVSDAVLGKAARQAQASSSAIEAQSAELDKSMTAMHMEDMNVTFDSTAHTSVINGIKSLGTVSVQSDPTQQPPVQPDLATAASLRKHHNRRM
jgi:B-box zinc finger